MVLPAKGWLVIDIETEGSPWDGHLLSISVSDPLDPEVFTSAFQAIPDWLLGVLADPDVGTVEHTLYDARWLRLAGVDLQGPIADTRVMAWNVDENTKLDLESLVFRYLSRRMDKRLRQVGGKVKFKTDDGDLVPIEEAEWDQMRRYNEDDTRQTAALFNLLLPMQPKDWEQQVKLTSVLLDMECAGLPIDMETLEWTRESYAMTRDQLKADLTKDLPEAFNINSADQVAAYLFLPEFNLSSRYRKEDGEPEGFVTEKEGRLYSHGHYVVEGLGMTPGKWTESEKRPKVDNKTLAVKYSKHPWVTQFLEYQKLNKILGTYLEGLPRYVHDGRVYGTFNQAGTVSGRLSSASPNMQNLPRRGTYGADIRRLFKGNLVIADFSQLEPRLYAHWSQDPKLLEIYRGGLDVYKTTGMAVFDVDYRDVSDLQREICKALVLSMGYGAQARKVAEILSIAGYPTTQKEAQAYLEAMRAAYPRFFEWREEVVSQSHDAGYVTTLAGRRRHIGYSGTESAWKAERQAVNSVIQGSAADIVNATMLEVADIPSVRTLVQVHDELVLEHYGNPDLEAIQYAGEAGHGYVLDVPLVFEPKVVDSWDMK